ncbi:MAG TPA: MFS transporter [Desulfotomaculum sp.]|nr:MAG: Major facilitator superfamily MFS_1 [Desulfotomaculum sp. 46_80]HAG11953.1 MFS transporter [Desulfotomaculum sp.]HBY04735.1 MFS transporter [Desulfotomaculum sp.]
MRSLLLLLFLTEFARGAFFYTFLPIWIVNDLSVSITIAGLTVSAHYLSETLFKTIAGWEFDRLGCRILIGGLFLSLLSLIIIKLWPVPAVLIGGAALFGFGFSPVWLGVISRVAPVRIPNRASRISLVFSSWMAGAGGGMVSINFFMSKSHDLIYWLIVILWALSLPVAWFAAANKNNLPEPAAKDPQGFLNALKKISSSNLTRLLIPGMFLQTLAAGLLLPVLPIFAQKSLLLSHNQYGMLLLIGGAATVISLLPMGYLADRLALKALLATGFGASSLMLILLTYCHGFKEIICAAVLLGFSYAMVLPAWNSLLAKIVPPESQATGWGVFATIEGLGITFGPALGAFAAGRIGLNATLIMSACVLLIAAFFYLLCPFEKMLVNKQQGVSLNGPGF